MAINVQKPHEMSALIDTQTGKLRAQLLGAMVCREAREPPPQRRVRCDGRLRPPRHNETRVCRFVKVKGKVSPFDLSLRDYEDRRLRRLVRDVPTRAGNRRNDLLADALAL